MLEIATDLERVGDYAVDISKNAIKLSDQPMRPQKVEIDRIASVAHGSCSMQCAPTRSEIPTSQAP